MGMFFSEGRYIMAASGQFGVKEGHQATVIDDAKHIYVQITEYCRYVKFKSFLVSALD